MFRLIVLLFISFISFQSLAQTTCNKVNGNGPTVLYFDYSTSKRVFSLSIPESRIGSALRISEKFTDSNIYGVILFFDDGSITYTAQLGTDASSDYILYTLSGDIDTEVSFYRCPKSGFILD